MFDERDNLQAELDSRQPSNRSAEPNAHSEPELEDAAMDVDIEDPIIARISLTPQASFSTPLRLDRQSTMGLPTPESNDRPARRRLSGQNSLPVIDSPSLNRGTEGGRQPVRLDYP